MTTFYLIRHAEKDAPEDVLAGRTGGIALTERGRRQAEVLARRLARERIELVCSSPLQRARETAARIAAAKGREVQVREEIGEIDFGGWTGKTFGELADDAVWRRFNAIRGAVRAPGGETVLDVQARMVGEILRLREAYPEAGVALVSHGDPIRVAIAHFLGAPVDLFARIEISVASVSVLVLDEYEARITRLNEVAEENR